eukprot:UN10139
MDKLEKQEKQEKQLKLTQNNLQKHNKLYSINGKFVINKFLEHNNDHDEINIVKSKLSNNKSKLCKQKSAKNKLTKTKNTKIIKIKKM